MYENLVALRAEIILSVGGSMKLVPIDTYLVKLALATRARKDRKVGVNVKSQR